MKIEIRHRVTQKVLFSCEAIDLRDSIEQAASRQINLSGANLHKADLVGANLPGINLLGADLSKANLAWADLEMANLEGANMEGANLYRTNLVGAYINTMNLKGANLLGTRRFLKEPTLDQILLHLIDSTSDFCKTIDELYDKHKLTDKHEHENGT